MPIYQITGKNGKIYQIEGPSGVTKEQIKKKILARAPEAGLPPQEENALERSGALGNAAAAVADIPLSLVQGLAGTGKSFTDVFGAGNAASNFLGDVAETAGSWRSSESREDEAINAAAMKEAGKKGAWEQIKAAGSAFMRSPLDTTASLVGSAVPFVAAGLAAAPSGGSSLAPVAAMAGLGAASGAGTIKGSIYDATYKNAKEAGASDEQAAAVAEKAQEYGGENLDQIALGTVIGAAANATGLPRQISSAIGKRAAAEVLEGVAEETVKRTAPKSVLMGGVKGAVEEAVPEGLQGAQERYAQNKALQRQGYDVDPMEGVIGQGAFEGIASLFLGGVGGIKETNAENMNAIREEVTSVGAELPENPTDEDIVSATERFTRRGINEETARTIVDRLVTEKATIAEELRKAEAARAERDAEAMARGEAAPIEEEQFTAGEAPGVFRKEPTRMEREAAAGISEEEANLRNQEELDALARGQAAAPAAAPTARRAPDLNAQIDEYTAFAAKGQPAPAPLVESIARRYVGAMKTTGIEGVISPERMPAFSQFVGKESATIEPLLAQQTEQRDVGAEEANLRNQEALDALVVGGEAAPTAPVAPKKYTPQPTEVGPQRAADILNDPVRLSDFEASGGDPYVLDAIKEGTYTGPPIRYSRGRPSKTTADEGLFGALPTQEQNRLDKAEELQQLKLNTTPEERIAQQEEAGAAAATQIAQRTKLDEENRVETLGDIEFALRAQAPENAVYKVDYTPKDKKNPYKLVAETQLGKKPEVVLSAPTLQEFSDQVYGQMMELTPFVPPSELSAQTVEEVDTTEPTVATDMIRQFTSEVDTLHQAGQIDNSQRAELLSRLERPNAYRVLPNGQTKPNDTIARREAEVNKAMEEFRAAQDDQQREAATAKIGEINQQLTAAVQNGLLNPLRARMKTMVETRVDERLGARVRQQEAKEELGRIEARPQIAQAVVVAQNAKTELDAAKASFDEANTELAAAQEEYVISGGEGANALLPDVRRQYARVESAKAQVRKTTKRLRAAQESMRAANDKLRVAETGKNEAKAELREARIDERETKVQKYKRGEGAGMSPAAVQRIVNDIVSGWKSGVPVTVVSTTDQLPSALRAVVEADGATDAKGLVDTDGTVYLIASNLMSKEDARATLFHEGLGHIGLEKLFRERLDDVLKSLYYGNKNIRVATDKWMKENPDAYPGDSRIVRAVEEVLAEQSEAGIVPQSIMQRLTAVVRDFARRLGFDLNLSDGDVNAILSAAHRLVTKGDATSSAVKGVRYIFSRKKPKNAKMDTTEQTKEDLFMATGDVSDGLRRTTASQSVYGMAQGMGDAIRGHTAKPYLAGIKENLANMNPSVFKATLISLPTSGILDWFSGETTALKEVDKLVNKMTNMKANIIAAGDDIAQRIKAFVDTYGSNTLAAAQSISRINEYSPDEFASMEEALKKHGVITLVEDRILTNSNDKKRARQIIDELKALTLAGKSQTRVEEGPTKLTPEVRKLITELDKVAIDVKLTTDQVKQLTEMTRRIRDVHAAWDKLGEQKGGQKLYKDTRQFYKDMFEAELALLDARIEQVADKEQAKRLRDVRADLMRETLDPAEAKKKGDVFWDVPADLFQKDYFPFMRDGQYWLYVKAKKGKRERRLYTFENAKELNRAKLAVAKELGVDPNDQSELTFGNNIASLQEDFKNEDALMQKVFEIVNKAKATSDAGGSIEFKDISDAIYQTWLMTTPERSARRRMMHAEEVTGFSPDVLNQFSRQVTAYANQLSKMAYAGRIRGEIKGAYENIKDRPNDRQSKLRDVIDEIKERTEQEINPEPQGAVVNFLNRMSFFYYLTSAATALVQPTSIPIRVVPRLWRQYGYAKGTAMWVKYMNVYKSIGIAKTEKIKTGMGDQLHALMPSVLGSDFLKKGPKAALLQKAAKAASERNLLQTVSDTLVQNEREVARKESRGVAGAAADVATETAKVMGVMFNGMENISRQVSFFMTFELAYDDFKAKNPQATEDEAFEHALEEGTSMIRDTMGDFSSFERPRLAKGNVTRALFLFKMYAIIQTKFFVQSFNAIVRGTGGDRVGAMKELTGVLMMAGMFGGLTGMPLYSLMAWALAEGFDDEDDEDVKRLMQLDPRMAYDSDTMFRKWIMDKMNNPEDKNSGVTLADMLIHGPVSAITNTDVASRTSLDLKNMWFRETAAEDSTAMSAIKFAIANIAGGQMAVQILNGWDDFTEGNIENGLKKMLPAFFRSWVATAQAAHEGVKDSKGNVIIPKEDIDGFDSARSLLGFRPMDLARWQDYYITRAKNEKAIESEKRKILDGLEKGIRDGDIKDRADFDNYIAEEIIPFNRTYPDPSLAITMDTIERSLKGRATARANTVQGMQVTKKTAQRDVSMAEQFRPK
jgi:hypothetical protein